jgi:lysozyme
MPDRTREVSAKAGRATRPAAALRPVPRRVGAAASEQQQRDDHLPHEHALVTDYFIDASEFQGSIDWRAYRRAGHRRAVVKATEGVSYRDHYFTRGRWDAMRQAGVKRGAYHFAHPGHNDAVAEARHFIAAVRDVGGRKRGFDLPLILDCEVNHGLSGAQLVQWCSRFCNYVKKHTGRGCVLYTGAWFWGNLPAPENGGWAWLSGYPGLVVPRAFRGRVFAHQFTDKAHVAGVSGLCDESKTLIRGAQLRALYR